MICVYVQHMVLTRNKQTVKTELFFCGFPSGPLTEVHMPIDSFTKKVKGFAFVTYMIPENAVKALAELDGKAFQVVG